jgi:glycosyltransferase involved in cell wall biosynthesis
MKIVHVINGLDIGGAETMMLRLLSRCDRQLYDFEVISLTDLGVIADDLRALNIPVRALGMRRDATLPNPAAIFGLQRWLRRSKPDLVQTWMYHANLIGGLAAKMAVRAPLIWGIRQTNVDLVSVRLRTSLIAKGAALLSNVLPDHILYNSHVSRRAHGALGYADKRAGVIPNGFDLEVFKPDPAARSAIRGELGLDNDTPLVGLIARYDPQKDHATFIAAVGLVHSQHPGAHFLAAGLGVDAGNDNIMAAIDKAGIADHCHLLGHRSDIPGLMAALDIACSSSMGEGFPNTVGEAMACGVPCVVTDVGDSAHIVGDTGKVAPPGNSAALAQGLSTLLSLPPAERHALGLSARQRIGSEFSLATTAQAYQNLWRTMTGSAHFERFSN